MNLNRLWTARLVRAMAWIALVAAGTLHAASAEEFSRGSAPDWVEPVGFEYDVVPDESQVKNGAFYLLGDYQVNLDPAGRESYRHFAAKAVTDQGVDTLANIEIQYQPEFQTLRLHQLQVLRDGKRMSQLDTAEVRLLQREAELEAAVIDGSKSASIIMTDVRVGDIVEFAYTITGSNPVFGGMEAGAMPLQWEQYAHDLRQRLRVPNERAITPTVVNSDRKPLVSHGGTHRDYRWAQHGVPALLVDSEAPAWFDPYPVISWSEFADWSAVERWAHGLFRIPDRLGPELTERIAAIREAHSTPVEQVTAALRLVQGDVRYLGIEIGSGSHAPSAPDLVFQRRFGDCKDKSLLLVSLLAQLDIDARVALVNTDRIVDATARPPSPHWFNHAIVEAQIGGKAYWLDPTLRLQPSPLATLYQPDYGLALIIDRGPGVLTPMTQARRETLNIDVVYDLRKGIDQDAVFTVNSTYEGNAAENTRSRLANTARDEVEKSYLNFYASYFSGIVRDGELKVSDDIARNQVRVEERYRIPGFWSLDEKASRRTAQIEMPDLLDYLDTPSKTLRNAPIGLRHPFAVQLNTEVLLPEDWPEENEDLTVDDPHFRFVHRIGGKNAHFLFEDSYHSLADHVPAAASAQYASNIKKAREQLGYEFYYNLGVKPPSSLDEMNWTVALLALLMIAGFSWIAHRLYRYDPPSRAEEATRGSPAGISGWLILPAIGLCFAPLRLLMDTRVFLDAFAMSTWIRLTNPGSEAYHPGNAPLLLAEMAANIAYLVMILLTASLFFSRRSSTPRVYIAMLALPVFTGALDLAMIKALAIPSVPIDPEQVTLLVRAAISLAIWGAYFQVSERVKATFTRRLDGSEDQPAPEWSIAPKMDAVLAGEKRNS